MRCCLEPNVLVYAEGFGDEPRVAAARQVLERLEQDDVVIPVQCIGELFRVLTTKAGRSRAEAQEAVLSWMDSYPLVETSSDVWRGAMDLCAAHPMSSWDALVLNASAVAGARLLLSEDLHPGFHWGGVRVVNPFALPLDPLLLALLS
jgi:predicted nucleic acid-binding protein